LSVRQTWLVLTVACPLLISGVYAQAANNPVLAVNPATGIYNWKLPPNQAAVVTFKATGGTAPYSFAVASETVPTGMTFDGAKGTLSGTPSVAGFFPFSVQVTDSQGNSSVTPVSFTIVGTGPMILTQTLPNAQSGVSYYIGLAAVGGHPGTAPYTYTWYVSAGTLPPGIQFNNGFFSGTPFITGAFNFVVTVKDFTGASYIQPLTLTVVSLTIDITTLPDAVQGSAYSQTFSAANGAPPLYWSIASGTLPNGLIFSHSGVLSGTPESAGLFVFTVQVSDGANRTAQQQMTLNVIPLLPLVVTSKTIPTAVQGQPYSVTLGATGGNPPYQWSLFSGVLPPGITLNAASGLLSGTTTQLGQFPAEFQVRDQNGTTARVALTLVVEVPKPAISSVVNGASFSPGNFASPGSILSVFASSLGSQDQLNGFPATSLLGVTVTLNGTPAPLFAVAGTKNQINLMVPWDAPASGTVDVEVTSPNGSSAAYSMNLEPSAPGIFRVTDPSSPSRRFAVALFSGSAWLALPSATAAALHIATNCTAGHVNKRSACGQPAKAGDILEIFTTGLGLTVPKNNPAAKPLSGAQLAPANGDPLYATVLSPSVTIGGAAAEVLFSGAAPGFAGLYQVNVVVPGSAPAGDAVPVRITMPNGLNDEAPIAIAGP
jgi:uncharacterized protein (TIGR03437 family)